jgi:hypothetical protein
MFSSREILTWCIGLLVGLVLAVMSAVYVFNHYLSPDIPDPLAQRGGPKAELVTGSQSDRMPQT